MGYMVVDDAGNFVKAIRRTNPNSKFDWCGLGGRWTGFFKLKKGATGKLGKPGLDMEPAGIGCADAAYKKDIDFDQMRSEERRSAEEQYDKFHAIIKQYPDTKSFDKISNDLLEQHRDNGDDLTIGLRTNVLKNAGNIYAAQPGIAVLSNAGYQISNELFRYYNVSKEEFVANAVNQAISTYAFVKDGTFFSKMDDADWQKKFNNMLDNLPDDTLLSVYDCHI